MFITDSPSVDGDILNHNSALVLMPMEPDQNQVKKANYHSLFTLYKESSVLGVHEMVNGDNVRLEGGYYIAVLFSDAQ